MPEEARQQVVTEVVLASASPARARVLTSAGVPHQIEAAAVDEAPVKVSLRGEGADPLAVAETLAELKAQRVSNRHPAALVIGADQILVCNDVWFDKPQDMRQAADHLKALRGRTHHLATAICIVEAGRRIWHHRENPALTMRSFDEAFIEHYLERVGSAALESVGAYQLEGLGAQLFTRIDGEFFSILGLPLLPLMAFLRDRGVLDR